MKRHWPEYLTEAAGLGFFMVSASLFGVLLYHPRSPVFAAIPAGFVRNACMGLAMALTSMALVHSRWGKQSGAHFNPAVTLTFYRLGKVAPQDAAAYVVAQFLGGTCGMLLASALLGPWVADPGVNYVVTQPGRFGDGVAWTAEFLMTFALMTVVLVVSGKPGVARFTGVCAAACVFLFITFVSPLSGMSLNPARTFASSLAAGSWVSTWVYFTAPLAGMLGAAGVYVHCAGKHAVRCAKLHHQNPTRCIFCEHQAGLQGKERVRIPEAIPLTRV